MRRWVQTECLWLISDDPELEPRVEEALKGKVCTRVLSWEKVDETGFWRCALTLPSVVLLHLDEDLNRGARVLRDIKGAHLKMPVIVLSREFNTEFASKIISEGASYFMLWDFDSAELNEVVQGLLSHLHQEGK